MISSLFIIVDLKSENACFINPGIITHIKVCLDDYNITIDFE